MRMDWSFSKAPADAAIGNAVRLVCAAARLSLFDTAGKAP